MFFKMYNLKAKIILFLFSFILSVNAQGQTTKITCLGDGIMFDYAKVNEKFDFKVEQQIEFTNEKLISFETDLINPHSNML